MSTSWPLVPLRKALNPVSRAERVDPSKEYSLLGVRLDGQGPFLREKKLGGQIAATSLYKVCDGDFIYSRLFAWRGAFGVIDSRLTGCYVSGEFPVFRPVDDKIDLQFLFYWFRLPRVLERVEADCTGSTPLTRNRFKEEFFSALEIPLPPLTEQRRIVASIEELASKIEEARGLRQQAVEEAEGLVGAGLAYLFEGLSAKWPADELGTHVQLQGGFAFKSEEYIDTGLPIIRISNLENETVHTVGSPCMPEQRLGEFERFVLSPGDILIALTGATTGKLGIVPDDCKTWLLNQRVGRFRLRDHEASDPKYVYWLARGVQKKVFETAYGGAQPNISPSDIEGMAFPFPQLDEQRRIVAYLDGLQSKVDALMKLQGETATELDAMLPSVLDKAFKGEL